MSDTKIPYSAHAVANYFLDKSKDIDPMKLQKLLYYAQGWYLSFTEQPIFKNKIEAWEFGPVIATVYHEFKKFGRNPIREKATEIDCENWSISEPRIDPKDSFAVELLEAIWNRYGGYSGVQLSNATHLPGTPWDKARKEGKSIIENEVIKEYFDAIKEKAA